MTFDFVSYLARLDPSQYYIIKRLTGGLINETVRAVKRPSLGTGEGIFPGYQSIVLKYAPPYVAALGESVPLSQTRQSIEAAGLSLFTSPSGKLVSLCSATSIGIPQLLHHDYDAKILVMSDLGELPNLTDCLISGHPSILLDLFSVCKLGTRLGNFFAVLHSPQTLGTVLANCVSKISACEYDSRRFIYEATVLPVLTYLLDFNISNASELYRRVYTDFHRADEPSERSFVLGDCWPGAVLAGDTAGQNLDVGVIDWEFAGEGRGITGDMAQLLAHIHLHLLAAPTKSSIRVAIKSLISSITASYHKQSRKDGRDWAVLLSTRRPTTATRAMRSAFLLHGREMINNAVERDWPCSCCLEKQGSACTLRRTMVEQGAWYLRYAQTDDDQFADELVLARIIQRETILTGLFFNPIAYLRAE